MTESQLDQTTVPGSVATDTTTTKRRRSSNSEEEPVCDLGGWRRAGTEPPDWEFSNVFGPRPDHQAKWDPEEFDPESVRGNDLRCASPDTMAGDQRGENTQTDSVPAIL